MASYTLKLTPTLRNLGTEGSLDTAIVNGASIQRGGYIETVNGDGGRKVSEMLDGQTFTDVVQTLTDLDNGSGANWIV